MAYKRLYLVPVFGFLLLPVVFIITYTIAVLDGHVYAVFPYFSDTGSLSPESCIFGQFINISAGLLLACLYVRYLQVQQYTPTDFTGKGVNQKLNITSLVFGALSCLGLDILANFQISNILFVHLTGAMLCFCCGTIYLTLQVWISHKMSDITSKCVLLIRVVLAILSIVVLTTTLTFTVLSGNQFTGSLADTRHWDPDQPGWVMHVISTVSEWSLCITFCLLVLSFVPDFYNCELEPPRVIFKKEEQLSDNINEIS